MTSQTVTPKTSDKPPFDSLFLTADEIDHLERIGPNPPGFIADFVALGARKSDASPYALRGGALIALSLAAGDTVVLPPFFGNSPIYLNVFILLLGQSTIVRKSTVLGFAMALNPRTASGDTWAVLQEDFSKEALMQGLAQANEQGRPTSIHLDEAFAIFKNMKTSSHFLNGLDSPLMRIYDHSPVKIHRVAREYSVPHGAFASLLAASTPDKLRGALTEEDFTSGLLPRFIVLHLDNAAAGTAPSFRERVANHDEFIVEEKRLRDFLTEDILTNEALNSFALSGTSPEPLVLPMAENVLDRIDVMDKENHRLRGITTDSVSTIRERALVNIMKVAGLLKLSRTKRKGKVEMDDLLRAIFLLEATTVDLIELSEGVGVGETTELLDYVEEVVKKCGRNGLRSAGYLKGKSTQNMRSRIDEYRPDGAVGLLNRLTREGRLRPMDGGGWRHPHTYETKS